MRPFIRIMAAGAVVTGGTIAAAGAGSTERTPWSPEQRAQIASLALSALEPLPPDPSNRVADDTAAASLGHALFFDESLSSTGTVSCATCHLPERGFQDGKPLGVGVGTAGRRTMPIAGTARSPWLFWDGRASSLWEQALGPLESAVEHGGDRVQYVRVLATRYRERYERVFGALPSLDGLPRSAGPVADSLRAAAWKAIPEPRREAITRAFANMGKAIAAYERRLSPAPSRFDRYAESVVAGRDPHGDAALTGDERAGLALFIGRAECTTCHDGPLFTDGHFHNVGAQLSSTDSGRVVGVRHALASEFSCTSVYGDAGADDCRELRFADTDSPELVGAFKTPSLRGVSRRAPFFHGGQFSTLEAVIDHYSRAPRAVVGKSELRKLSLSARDARRLEAFLRTLDSPVTAPPGFLSAPFPHVTISAQEAGHAPPRDR